MTHLFESNKVKMPSHAYTVEEIKEAVETFKSIILRIRDILRGPGVGITGMDSMRTICIYLTLRYLTKEKAKEFNIPEQYSWESIHGLLNQNDGLQLALNYIFDQNDDCLMDHFDKLFDTKKFSFDIQDLNKNKEILELLSKIDMDKIACHIDILGWVYEQHLSTGSSSASRDLGQYFTDRFICHYMTDLCKPGFKSPGVPESVLDPTMGTGGFLSSYVKYFREHYTDTPVDWGVQQKELYGCDSDSRVSAVARLNMFMDLGGHVPTNMKTHDSLYKDVALSGFDVILANMPFGVKGIKHADCCDRVKNLKIRGTKSEPLFLQLMMASLNEGGRCAVVVPDGMLVNTPNLHKNTRKYLIDHLNLKRVIKMKGKYFMNTSIEPSILYFENTGPTEFIEFWDVVRDDHGHIEETMTLRVSREQIDEDYSLDKRRYMPVVEPVNMTGYPMVKLGDVCEFVNKIKYFASNAIDHKGTSPFYNGCYKSPMSTHSKPSYTSDVPYYIMIKGGGSKHNHTSTRMGMGMVFMNRGECTVASQNKIFVLKDFNPITYKYVYYYLTLNVVKIRNLAKYSLNLGQISMESFKSFKLPLPPMEVQQQIVDTLDRIYQPGTSELRQTMELTQNAMDLVLSNPDGSTLEPIVEAQRLLTRQQQMVADLRQQMKGLVRSLDNRGFDRVALGDVCEMKIGGTPRREKHEYYNGDNVWVSVREVGKNKYIYDSKEKLTNKGVKNSNVKRLTAGTVLMSFKLSIGKCSIAGVDLYTNEAIVGLKTKETSSLSQEYLYYYLKNTDYSNHGSGSMSKGSMNKKSLSKITLPIPPLEFQQSFVERLDNLQTQIDAFEEYEQSTRENAQFMLEGFLGTV